MMIRLAMTLWGIVIVIVMVVDRDVIGDVEKTNNIGSNCKISNTDANPYLSSHCWWQ
jgi:hypothetical protein